MNKNEEKAKSLYFHYCNEKSCKGYDECTNCPNAKIDEGLIQMAEWKERQMIEKACRWLDDNITNDPTRGLNTKYSRSITHGELLQEFKKAMEE